MIGKITVTLITTIAALFGLVVIFGSFYTIDEGERGIVLTNGKVTAVVGSGFHFKTPIFDEVVTMSTRVDKIIVETAAYSADNQTANLGLAVNYRVDPALVAQVYTQFGDLEQAAARMITPRAVAGSKIVFGQFNAIRAVQERGLLNQEIRDRIAQSLQDTGLVIEDVLVEDVSFSSAFNNAIEQRMQAQVEVERLRQNLEREKVEAEIRVTKAGAERDSVKAKADGDAYATRETAKAQAEATELRGAAEAKAIEARGKALRENPSVVSLVTAERWDGQLPRQILPNSTLPMINLTEPTQ